MLCTICWVLVLCTYCCCDSRHQWWDQDTLMLLCTVAGETGIPYCSHTICIPSYTDELKQGKRMWQNKYQDMLCFKVASPKSAKCLLGFKWSLKSRKLVGKFWLWVCKVRIWMRTAITRKGLMDLLVRITHNRYIFKTGQFFFRKRLMMVWKGKRSGRICKI